MFDFDNASPTNSSPEDMKLVLVKETTDVRTTSMEESGEQPSVGSSTKSGEIRLESGDAEMPPSAGKDAREQSMFATDAADGSPAVGSTAAPRRVKRKRAPRSAVGKDPVNELVTTREVEGKEGGEKIEPGIEEKPRVLVLNTGGTLGMRKDQEGRLAPAPGYLTSQMLRMQDLSNSDDMPGFDIAEYEPLLDSSCFQPCDWVRIAMDIGRAYHTYDGFVVCMGTDTMAYTASAMSFMLENLAKTVVFTGSQVKMQEVYNDARRNMAIAMIMAANQEIPEVCLFFSDRLLRANRSVKVDSLALSAFESPNFPPLGLLGVSMRYRKDLVMPQPRGPFRVHTRMDSRVVVYKLIPGFDDEALLIVSRYTTKLRAVVLELYGTGNSPSRRKEFLHFIQVANERGILVVAVTQCRQGAVDLETYAVGAALKESGVISGGDMTTEAVVTKLAYLFGRTDDTKTVRRMMSKNLRGELSPSGSFVHPIYYTTFKTDVDPLDSDRGSGDVGPYPRL